MIEISSPSAGIQVDELEARRAFRTLETDWETLLGRQGTHAPLVTPAWFAIQAAALCQPPRRLRLLVAHERGRLIGALPLVQEERRAGGMRVRVLRSLSDDHSQRFELAAADETVVAALWRHLAADPSWDLLELREVTDDSRRAGLIHELAQADGFPVARWPSLRSPYLPLPGSVAQLEARLDAKFRANLRRRRRGLGELGPVRLERVSGHEGAAVLDQALADGLELERSGWKGERGTAVACDPVLAARYRAIARVFTRRGELSLHFLRAGERRVAFHFALESGGVYYLLKPGYDEELKRYGLGHLLVWEVARALVERGAREIDFLGDDMAWKREWTTLDRGHAWRLVYRPTLRGRVLHAWKTRAIPLLHQVQALRGGAD